MENNLQYDEFLTRYLFNEQTADEKVFAENWINASDENKNYFNRLKKAWQLTEIQEDLAYITDEANLKEKWNRLEQHITEDKAPIISIHQPAMSAGEYNDAEKPVRRSVIYRLLISAAIAASVLLVIGLGWKLFVNKKSPVPIAHKSQNKTDNLTFIVRHEVNTTNKEKRIQIQDGSLIVLAANSEVTYREPFMHSREFTLIGKAYFKVAPDKTKPFTVFSGAISTTATGTEFTVTTSKNASEIIVRLYEGKVVVKAVDKQNKKLKKEIHLLPGQAFVYGTQHILKIKDFKEKNTAAPEQILNEEVVRDNPSLPENAKSPYFMFNNQPLAEVFDNLAALYNVKIIYDKNDMQNRYFIGKYDTKDSVEMILKRIASLNNLTLTTKDDAYIISK